LFLEKVVLNARIDVVPDSSFPIYTALVKCCTTRN